MIADADVVGCIGVQVYRLEVIQAGDAGKKARRIKAKVSAAAGSQRAWYVMYVEGWKRGIQDADCIEATRSVAGVRTEATATPDAVVERGLELRQLSGCIVVVAAEKEAIVPVNPVAGGAGGGVPAVDGPVGMIGPQLVVAVGSLLV